MLVIHNIHLPPGEPGVTAFAGDAIERLFTNCLDPAAHECFAELSALRVSAHFLVRREDAHSRTAQDLAFLLQLANQHSQRLRFATPLLQDNLYAVDFNYRRAKKR